MTPILQRAKDALAGRYAVERELGSGGSATVFLARDLKHERPVAVKVLRPELAAAVGSQRFLREIRITAALNHPHVLPLLDSGEAHGLLFYVMPYLADGSLRRLINGPAPPTPEETLRVVGQVAAALEHAHGHDVLHRDIKPENILFSEGLAVVADFGLGRVISSAMPDGVTRSGVPLGTPGYMSPEQAMGTVELDARTDVYGLACVAYELLVGATLAMWPTDESLRMGRLLDAPPAHRDRLDALPGRMEQVLTRALAIRPADRFERPSAFAAALVMAAERTAKLDDAAVQAVIRRAAEIQALERPETGALSIGTVEQVAAEVGIPPEHVRTAARELGLDRPGLAPAARPATPVPSRPPSRLPPLTPPAPPNTDAYDVKKRRIVVERAASAAITDDVAPRLVEAIHATLGVPGHASVVGRTLTWSPAAQGSTGRRLVITVTGEEAGSRIHLEEKLELGGWKAGAPGWGGAGGAALGVLLSAGLPDLMPLFGIMCAAIGAFVSLNWVYWNDAVTRIPELEGLADRMTEILEGQVESGPALGSGGQAPALPGPDAATSAP